MTSKQRLKLLSPAAVLSLTTARLLAYRTKALSLVDRPEVSDLSSAEIGALESSYVWFKSDPRWQPAYNQIQRALSRRHHQTPNQALQRTAR